MGKYSIYAAQLDAAFKEARRKYKEAFDLMKSKKKEMEDIQRNPSLVDTFGMKAEYDYKSAKSNFEKLETAVWEDFDRQRAEIRAALESTFRKVNEPRPEDVDRDGLELLRSGILTIDEIGGFLDRYENSPAMRRLTDQHIEKLLEETKDPQSRHALIMLRQKAGVSDVIEVWESLEHTARICSGQSHGRGEPSYVLSISGKWEELTATAIAAF